MRFRFAPVLFCSACLTLAHLGCRNDGSGGGGMLLWPPAAREGDTVAVAIDSNYIPIVGGENFELSRQNVDIRLEGPTGLSTLVEPRAVFEGTLGLPSKLLRTEPGARTTVVLFDIPDMSCGDIGRLIVNDVLACNGSSGTPLPDCTSLVTTSTRAEAAFVY